MAHCGASLVLGYEFGYLLLKKKFNRECIFTFYTHGSFVELQQYVRTVSIRGNQGYVFKGESRENSMSTGMYRFTTLHGRLL